MLCYWIRSLADVKMSVVPEIDVWHKSNQNLIRFLCRNWQVDSRIYKEMQKTKTSLKGSWRTHTIYLQDLLKSHSTLSRNWSTNKDREIVQWNRVENSKMYVCKQVYLLFKKGLRQFNVEKNISCRYYWNN